MANHKIVDSFIYNLFINPKKYHPNLHSFLLTKEPLNILDLGCSVPENLFNLYHIHDCKILKGVDKLEEQECVTDFINNIKELGIRQADLKKIKSSKSFFNIYSKLVDPIIGEEKEKITEEEEFGSIFLKDFYDDGLNNFFRQEENKYDLIIASNILHLYRSISVSIEWLKEIKFLLKPDGLLVVRVEEKGEDFNYDYFKKEFENIFSVTDIYEKNTGGKWKYSIMLNKEGLLNNTAT